MARPTGYECNNHPNAYDSCGSYQYDIYIAYSYFGKNQHDWSAKSFRRKQPVGKKNISLQCGFHHCSWAFYRQFVGYFHRTITKTFSLDKVKSGIVLCIFSANSVGFSSYCTAQCWHVSYLSFIYADTFACYCPHQSSESNKVGLTNLFYLLFLQICGKKCFLLINEFSRLIIPCFTDFTSSTV